MAERVMRVTVNKGMHVLRVCGETPVREVSTGCGVGCKHLVRLPEGTALVVKLVESTQAEGPVIHPPLNELSAPLRQRVEAIIKVLAGKPVLTHPNVTVENVELTPEEVEKLQWTHGGVFHSQPIRKEQ